MNGFLGAEQHRWWPASGLGKAMRAFINGADTLGTSLGNYARNIGTLGIVANRKRSSFSVRFTASAGFYW